MLIGSNAVDSFTARSFYQNYNVIPTSHTAPTICFCILEMCRKKRETRTATTSIESCWRANSSKTTYKEQNRRRIFPFMTHMLCCHIEKYFHLPSWSIHPLPKARKFEPYYLTLRMISFPFDTLTSSPANHYREMISCHVKYRLISLYGRAMPFLGKKSVHSCGAKWGGLMVPRRKFFTAASVSVSILMKGSKCSP